MDLSVFARGFGLGFSIAAVLGPIGVLCLRRALVSGFRLGFVSGLGAATADATYAAVAAFGVSAVATLLVDQRFWFRLIGGVFLLYLGQAAMPAPVVLAGTGAFSGRLLGAYASTLGLTLSNPMTILSFGAIFAGLGFGALEAGSPVAAVALVAGVFGGSAAWWLGL